MRIFSRIWLVCAIIACTGLASYANQSAGPLQATDLRLIPFPKEVRLQPGHLAIQRQMRITVSDSPTSRQLAQDLAKELKSARRAKCSIEYIPAPSGDGLWSLSLSHAGSSPGLSGAITTMNEAYRVEISSAGATTGAHSLKGLVWGIQTLRQLVRANMVGSKLPCLDINDWPSLEYRGYQDDITRGPSPKLEFLETEANTSSYLKMNFFTYYQEYQYQFKKHPVIGPKDGSFTPDELKALVAYAKDRGVEIIGCQQSFGHFAGILKHDEFKDIRETEYALTPAREESYKLLDDMYSEEIPLTDSPFFNVCCDEVSGLGQGPAKSMVEQSGVGNVYADHMRRLHDMVKDKYGRRIMMWGDIITENPKSLLRIPKDTVMLAWGYSPLPSFESWITPFSSSGYDFFVCPGVNCWSRILPDFDAATVNIQNFVRDGVKLGAKGMLNTTWDDDGENFGNYNWYGAAWGAECSWNGSTTDIKDFNRRIGAVLFGEKDAQFGRAINLLAQAEKVPGFTAWDDRFWAFDDGHVTGTVDGRKELCQKMISLTDEATKNLNQVKIESKSQKEAIDYYQFGADRFKLIATRSLAFLEASKKYEMALDSLKDTAKAVSCLDQSAQILKNVRAQHAAMKTRYISLWNRENKPYALDWTTAKYDRCLQKYDSLIAGIEKAKAALKETGTIPTAKELAIDITEDSRRATKPSAVSFDKLSADTPWADSSFARRIGISLGGTESDSENVPVEILLPMDSGLSDHVRLYELNKETGAQSPLLCQIRSSENNKQLFFLANGKLAKNSERSFLLYFQPKNGDIAKASSDLSVKNDPNGGVWVENAKLRLYIGTEGGHIYRWEVKDLNNLNLTYPGGKEWQGFADEAGGYRTAQNKLEVIESGDALVRVRCSNSFGMKKTISLWTGMPWVEVTYNDGLRWFWSYDDPAVIGETSITRGDILFSDGTTMKVQGNDLSIPCPASKESYWGAKYHPASVMLGIVTPERLSHIWVGPGGPRGGVGIENSPASSHFVIYGGAAPASPKQTLDLLRNAVDFTNPARTTVFSTEDQR